MTNILEFYLDRPVFYQMSGKFESPSPNWMHEDMPRTDFELFVVTNDTLYVTYNNIKYTVKTGDFLLIPPLSEPNNHICGHQSSNCSFYWLHFSCNKTAVDIVKPSSYPYPVKDSQIAIPIYGTLPSPEKIIVLMRQLQDSAKSYFHQNTLNYMTSAILCAIHDQFYSLNKDMQPSKKTQKQMYYDIIDYIKLNISQNLKVNDIAKHFGYNEKYLSHLFCNISNVPLKQYILSCKMNVANFLLTDTNRPISDIAGELGFSDSHNFSKAYKKVCGMTPSEYRNTFSKRLLFNK